VSATPGFSGRGDLQDEGRVSASQTIQGTLIRRLIGDETWAFGAQNRLKNRHGRFLRAHVFFVIQLV